MIFIIVTLGFLFFVSAIRDKSERWYTQGRLDEMDKKTMRKWWEFFL